MTTKDAIRLREAEARFTRAKAGVDGTELAEVRYQKAKRELAGLRRGLRSGTKPYVKPGDATAFPRSLQANTKKL